MKKTLKIAEILEKIKESKREEITKTFDECLKSICCEDFCWKDFEVHKDYEKIIKSMLENLSAEYIMAVCDMLHQKYIGKYKVELSIKLTNKDEDIFTVNKDKNEVLVIIPIKERQYKEWKKQVVIE